MGDPALQLDLILRGQSNAVLLAELEGWAGAGRLVAQVEELLGFDGANDRVRLVYDRDGQGGETAYPGTAFLGDWKLRDGEGWRLGEEGSGFQAALRDYRADGMGEATAILWMHSEYDSRDPALSSESWMSAVRADAALTRGALGREVPYLFVAAHPYGDGTDTGHQAIRAGMERLAADAAFDARIAARVPDLDVSYDDLDGNWRTTEYGFAHITPQDAMLIANRAARAVAEQWAEFARPGSWVAQLGGDIASDGPRVVAATALDAMRLQVDVRHDATTGFAPLSAGAEAGLGWSVALPDGRRLEASGAAVLDEDSLVVSFAEPLPAGAVLDYAWGIGRTAAPGGPGQGHAITDPTWLPVWTPAEGVRIGGGEVVVVTPPGDPAAEVALRGHGRPGTPEEIEALRWALASGVGAEDLVRALSDWRAQADDAVW